MVLSTPTGPIRGLNWADTRDNFQADILLLSGLGPDDTHSSAAVVADRIVGQMYALTGANTVRMPINEATVANYWSTYTGAVDMALTKGRVILCYWAAKDGRPQDLDSFIGMWKAVLESYGSTSGVYFEPINEPHGYSAAKLNDFYADWLAAFPSVSRERVILDGSGYSQVPATVGRDSRLDGCLLAYHEYAFFKSLHSESAWQSHIRTDVGEFSGRTVCTEFGAAMSPVELSRGGVERILDYDEPSSNGMVRYVRAMTAQFRAWGMGSVYWPGVRDNDGYALCTRSGSGADITLAINNASGLALIQYGWGGDTTLKMPPVLARPNLLLRMLERIGLG